jgi:predicted ferric reductase
MGKEEHPFSYLSSPREREVGFAVRASGDFTNKLAALKGGDRVRLTGGFGDFRPGKERALCFIASGIGTVPSSAYSRIFTPLAIRGPSTSSSR